MISRSREVADFEDRRSPRSLSCRTNNEVDRVQLDYSVRLFNRIGLRIFFPFQTLKYVVERKRILVERGDGFGDVMSPQGVMDLWEQLVDGRPEITGVIIEVNRDHELPDSYVAEELDGSGNAIETG